VPIPRGSSVRQDRYHSVLLLPQDEEIRGHIRNPGKTASNEGMAGSNEAAFGSWYPVTPMRQLLSAPPNNERSPRYMEKALAAIHQANRRRQTVILEYGCQEGRVGLYARYPDRITSLVAGPIQANYPRCTLQPAERTSRIEEETSHTWSAELSLEPELFPILRHAQFEDLLNGNFADPINSLLQAIKPDAECECRIEFHITPAARGRRWWATSAVNRLDRPFFRSHEYLAHFYAHHVTRRASWPAASLVGMMATPSRHQARSALETSSSRHHEREEDLQAASEKMSGHLFDTRIRLIVTATHADDERAHEQLEMIAGAFGAFTRSRLALFHLGPVRKGKLHRVPQRGFLLSHEELATLWHPPTATVEAEKMQSSEYRALEAPTGLVSGAETGAVPVGCVHFRNDHRPVGLSREDRRRHVHIIGRTGVGKTTLLLNQICSDIERGSGLALVDPHGDLAIEVIRRIPRHRTNEVIVFDAASREHAIAFNPLACSDPSRVDQVTSGAVSAFKKLHGDSWGPRLENTLRNAVFAIVEQGGTLKALLQLLTDEAFRERTVPRIQDDVVRAFWMQEFAGWTKAYRIEAVAAITNKIQPFLTSRSVRAIVSHDGASLDLRRLMDEGKVLIVNLSKGRVGEDNAALLGAFLVTAIQQAAMTRADIPEEERRDFFLYIDEFQNFLTSSFDTILSEARKYRLNLTVSHQYREQLDDSTAAAIAGNIGSIISFAVGSDDAEWLANAMCKYPGELAAADLTNLPRFTAYARLLCNGMPTRPFSMTTLPPPLVTEDRTASVVNSSQRRFSQRAASAAQIVPR
jgi:hypothetical protein